MQKLKMWEPAVSGAYAGEMFNLFDLSSALSSYPWVHLCVFPRLSSSSTFTWKTSQLLQFLSHIKCRIPIPPSLWYT
ncbi:hypothetical protein Agabi119p4_5201 [Agaricus bisporus var. burnettii]|uniref:Uncharacterized protein n=1 Tax=Agaricus bisporus var. burnettii TaxID=192524 RepID=A0A8H7KI51_AGABI|nr:hypothetical protein Agabi119p4_5201 [Agaricus bisporus var. burnettii]